MFFSKVLTILFSTFSFANTYSLKEAYTSVWLSGATYCNKENYDNMVLTGPASGFVVTDTLYDRPTDMQGFIGYLPSTKTIYVTFRGSYSVLNWIDNLQVKKIPYYSYPECNCSVHKGFYTATLNLKTQVIMSILSTKRKTGYSKLIVSGHSLGAAVGQLTAMELKNHATISKMTILIYNFGQPRIGDYEYSQFITRHTNDALYRYTHYKDIVPHIPPREMEYYHSCMEIYENENGDLYNCSKIICEDPRCSDQYPLKETNTDDHSIYLGHYLSCQDSATNVSYD
jgi:hypothetical protein